MTRDRGACDVAGSGRSVGVDDRQRREGGQDRLDRVVLIGDVADQLLDQVLDRDQAVRAAVLVHHDGHVRARAAAAWRARRRGRVTPAPAPARARQCLPRSWPGALTGTPNASITVTTPTIESSSVHIDREPAPAGLSRQCRASSVPIPWPQSQPRRPGVSSPRPRAFRRTGWCGAAGPPSPQAGRLPSPSTPRAGRAPPATGRCQLLLRLHPHPAHQPVRGAVQHPDQPAEDAEKTRIGPAVPPGRAGIGRAMRRVLGNQLAEEHREQRGQHQRQALGHRVGGRRRIGSEPAANKIASAGSRQVARQQRGDGDAELRAGELER